MPNLLIIDPQDTPNIGRYKINYNFSILVFSSFTGIAASIFTNPNPTTVTVGGIPAGSTFPTDFYLQDMMDLLLYPAVTPNFTSFLISAQATTLEVGVAVAGSKTFTWTIANTADLQPNSIDIEDTTNATSLATGLADDGSETIFLSSVTKTVPSFNTWTISAQDTDTTVFSRTYDIEWRYAVFYGLSASLTLNAAAIVALTGTSLVTDVNGSYSLAGSGYGYLCVPNSFSVPNGFRDSVTNLPLEMAGTSEGYNSFDGAFFYDSVSVTRNGIPITYRVYRTKYSITTTTMNVAVTGGTVATLQSVINAGNIATGNAAILGNFSATTYYSGSTPLSTILTNYLVGVSTYVQPGVNITTGGTPNSPIVNVVASPLFTSVSATTFYSAGTDLNFILNGSGSATYVQPGLNITTGGTASRPIINVLGSPTFTAVTASSVFATSLSGGTLYSGNTLLQNALTLQTVVNAGNTAERSIYLQGDGSSGTLLRKVIFRDTDPGSSGTSDPSIGIDYNIVSGGAQLLLESPDSVYQITKGPIAPATSYPLLVPSYYIGEDTGLAPPIWMGFLSAFTTVGRVYNYIRISEKDITNGYGGEVLLTATGTSAASYGQFIANFPAKSGTVAMLSDLVSASTTFVQPGTNITTGGTITSPVVSVIDDPNFSAVTAHSVFATTITGTTFYSGSTPFNTLFSLLPAPDLQAVTDAGNTTSNDIYMTSNGDPFAIRGIYFQELGPSYSGSSNPFIGADYNNTFTPNLTFKSSAQFFFIDQAPLQSLGPGITGGLNYYHQSYQGGIFLGNATAGTELVQYITFQSNDYSTGFNDHLTLAVTGLTNNGGFPQNHMLYLPIKSGIIATLDDVTGGTSTYVQPGLNITTGGTINAPVVNLATSIFLSGVTANYISGTSISATTFFSGNTDLNDIIGAISNPTLDQVLSNGHIAVGRNMVLSGTVEGGGGSLFVGTNHVFDESDLVGISGSTIIGGWGNTFSGSGYNTHIIGSVGSTVSSDDAPPYAHFGNKIIGSDYSTISESFYSRIIGSVSSLIRDGSEGAMIVGGGQNTASTYAFNAIIIGGYGNIVQYEDISGFGTIIGSTLTTLNGGNGNMAIGTTNSVFDFCISSVDIKGSNNLIGNSSGIGSFYSNNGYYFLASQSTALGSDSTVFDRSYYSHSWGSIRSSIINAGGPSVIIGSIGSYIVGGITPYDYSMSGNVIIGGVNHVLSGSNVIGATIIGGYANKLTHSGSTILGGHDLVSDAVDTVYMMNAKASNRITASVYYSGASELGSLFPVSTPTYVQPGLNTTTGGTQSAPRVNLAGSIVLTGVTAQFISGTSISATTYYSGNTPLNTILGNLASTYVQPGLNITTGGTANAPIVNVSGSIVLTAVTANSIFGTSISATTYYSGNTPFAGLFALSAHTHVSADITDSSYGYGFGADEDKLVKFGTGGSLAVTTDSNTAFGVTALNGNIGIFVYTDSGASVNVLSNYGVGLYATSEFSWGTYTESINSAALRAVAQSALPTHDIAEFYSSLLEGLIIKNDGGLEWTSPTGAETTRTNLGFTNVFVAPGTNTYTASTVFNTIVGVVGSPVFTGVTAQFVSGTSISATTYYSGSTPLNTILSTLGSGYATFVQPGLNITTGGTANAPIVNVAGSITLTAVTAVRLSGTSVSATTYYSGSTPLQSVFAVSAHTHVSADITDSSYGGNFSADADKLVKFGLDGSLMASTDNGAAFLAQSIDGWGAIVASAQDGIAGEFTSTGGTGIYGTSYISFGVVGESLNSIAGLFTASDPLMVSDIARFQNNVLEGLQIKNNGGLEWTTPTGAATTRTNLGLSNVFVAPGANTYTASTVFNTIVGVIGSPVFTGVTAQFVSGTSISATTYYSGSTPLNTILSAFSTGAATYVQPGLNITTGGTANAPIVNLAGSISLTAVTAVSMTAVTMSANSLVLESYSSNTTSSTASGLRVYDRAKAGRNMLETKDAGGVITNFQPHMGMTNVRFVKALGNGGTSLSSFGLAPIIGGTGQPKTYSTASLLGSLQRVGLRTTATPSTSATIIFNNGGTAPFWLGNLTNAGGFHAIFRFGIAQAQTNMRWFVGMYSAVTAINNVEPTSLGTILGFGINSGDTTVKFMFNDGSGTASVVDLGAGFPATSANTVYEGHIYVAPNSSTVNYYLERLDSTDKAEGSVNTNVPPSSVFLTPHVYINNATTSADAIMDFIQMQVETKY